MSLYSPIQSVSIQNEPPLQMIDCYCIKNLSLQSVIENNKVGKEDISVFCRILKLSPPPLRNPKSNNTTHIYAILSFYPPPPKKRLACVLFVLLLSTLVCCQPTEFIWAFLFQKFCHFTTQKAQKQQHVWRTGRRNAYAFKHGAAPLSTEEVRNQAMANYNYNDEEVELVGGGGV